MGNFSTEETYIIQMKNEDILGVPETLQQQPLELKMTNVAYISNGG